MNDASKTREAELLDLERKYWTAMKNGDAQEAMALSDDSCVITGAQGVGKIDRATLGKMLTGGGWTLTAFEITKPVVQTLSDDVAVIAYKVHEQLTVDGKAITLDASDTSVWVRRGGKWLCAVHTEAIAGDPFGRDRRAS